MLDFVTALAHRRWVPKCNPLVSGDKQTGVQGQYLVHRRKKN